MSAFQVTAQQLKAKADELKGLNSRFRNEISTLEEKEASLATMWEGEAQKTFRTAFQRDKVQMTNFYNAIEQYVSALLVIAAKYEQAESVNVNTAATRNY